VKKKYTLFMFLMILFCENRRDVPVNGKLETIADLYLQDGSSISTYMSAVPVDPPVDILDSIIQPAPTPGEILITEIYADPAVNSETGEFIEIYNTTDKELSLAFISVFVNGIFRARIGYFETILPFSSRVLAADLLLASATGLNPLFSDMATFLLPNSASMVELVNMQNVVLDSANYFNSVKGKSFQLGTAHYNTVDNDNIYNWGYGTFSNGTGEFTTPDRLNSFTKRPLAQIVINEVAAQRSSDYIELFVVQGGYGWGLQLFERGAVLIELPDCYYQTGDYILVHTKGVAQWGGDLLTQFDTGVSYAWDYYISDTGIAGTDGTIELKNIQEDTLDAFVYANNNGSWTGGASVDFIASSGQWVISGLKFGEPDAYNGSGDEGTSFQQVINGSRMNNTPLDWMLSSITPGYSAISTIGVISFDKCSYATLNDQVRITVTDLDADLNHLMIDSLLVQVSSFANSAGVTLTLVETSAASGVFSGVINFCMGTGCSGPGFLEVLANDEVIISFQDLDPYTIVQKRTNWHLINNGNLVCNPSFENPVFSENWTLLSAGTLLDDRINFIDGAVSVYFSSLTSAISGRELVSNCFSIVQGRGLDSSGSFITYLPAAQTSVSLKLWYFSDSSCTTPATKSFSTQTSRSLVNSGIWEQLVYSIPAISIPVDAISAQVSVRAKYVTGIGTPSDIVYFDNINVIQP